MLKLSSALKELRKQRQSLVSELSRLDVAIGALARMEGTAGGRAISSVARRPLSAAARRRIAQAQKVRWAAWRAKQKKEKEAA